MFMLRLADPALSTGLCVHISARVQITCLLHVNIGIFDVQRLSDDKEPSDVIKEATVF